MIQFPVEADKAIAFLEQQGLRDTDFMILPEVVASGEETFWRPSDRKTPILVTPAEVFDKAGSLDLALLAVIAENLKDQVYRVNLEEWTRRIIDRDENLSIQY